MLKSAEGSTQRLLQLCAGYFAFYAITGVSVKYFLGKPEKGFPGMNGIEYMTYSTLGGTAICVVIVLLLRWFKLQSARPITVLGVTFPSELLYIVPSGVCTAVVIPTTTLMYTLPISVMVAMVIMRGSVIVISRCVDAVQIRQGILKKKVFAEENLAVAFAILGVAVPIVFAKSDGNFAFLQSTAAMLILGSYLAAYSLRIYIMNYYKNTRPPGTKLDNNGFFAAEQLSATVTMMAMTVFFFMAPSLFGWTVSQALAFRASIAEPHHQWGWGVLSGVAYGIVAFFSVFIFMFKGRTATFAGLVNRLTSLIAGTFATLIFWLAFGGKPPEVQDWASLVIMFVAVGFLSIAEKKRAAEAASAQAPIVKTPALELARPVETHNG